MRAELRPRGRGHRRDVLVKWRGYEKPTWEPRVNLEHTTLYNEFVARYGTGDGVGEEGVGTITGPRKRRRAHMSTLTTCGLSSLPWLTHNGIRLEP